MPLNWEEIIQWTAITSVTIQLIFIWKRLGDKK